MEKVREVMPHSPKVITANTLNFKPIFGIIIIIIKDIYIAPFRQAQKALCKKKVKC